MSLQLDRRMLFILLVVVPVYKIRGIVAAMSMNVIYPSARAEKHYN